MKRYIICLMFLLTVFYCSGQISLGGFETGKKYSMNKSIQEVELGGIKGMIYAFHNIYGVCYQIAFDTYGVNASDYNKLAKYANDLYSVNFDTLNVKESTRSFSNKTHEIGIIWNGDKQMFLYLSDKALYKEEEDRKALERDSKFKKSGLSIGKFKLGAVMEGKLMDIIVDTIIAGHRGYLSCNRTDNENIIFQVGFIPMSDNGYEKILNKFELIALVFWTKEHFNVEMDDVISEEPGQIIFANKEKTILVLSENIGKDSIKAKVIIRDIPLENLRHER